MVNKAGTTVGRSKRVHFFRFVNDKPRKSPNGPSRCSAMAAFRTLVRSLFRNPNAQSLPSCCYPTSPLPLAAFSTSPLSPALAVTPNRFPFILRLTSAPSLLSSPPSRWVPFTGPLFLSSPPWKLLQSATPLYLRGKDAIFPKDLLQVRSFPIELGLRSLGEVRRGFEDVVGWRKKGSISGEVGTIGVDEKFLNLPNLVSISRLVSGPFIGW